MNFSAFLIWNYSWENPFASCIKGIQDSHGFWIPRRGFRIPVTGFQIFSSGTRFPDSNCQWDSRFLQLYSGFQTQGFRIPLAKIPGFRNPDSLTCIKGCKTVWDSGFRIPDLFQWNLDSGLQMSVGFQIPTAVFRFPRDRSPDSNSKNFLDSGIRIPLHWTKSIRVINSGMPSTFQILLTIRGAMSWWGSHFSVKMKTKFPQSFRLESHT